MQHMGAGFNRPGLGMRPSQSFGQGPSMHHQPTFVQPQQHTSVFVGSISAGLTDAFLNRLLSACGNVKSFKRLITPANKPQGFGFAEFEEPDSALRCMTLLNGIELPAFEEGAANKKLLVKVDEKTRGFLDAYSTQRMHTDADETALQQCRAKVTELVDEINRIASDAGGDGLGGEKEKYIIPPHLHDLTEADLPETQRGLITSEIQQFRERSAKREKEKERANQQLMMQSGPAVPNGPKAREWGKSHGSNTAAPSHGQGSQREAYQQQGYGGGAQGYSKPVGFVKENGHGSQSTSVQRSDVSRTDEELEGDRRESRRQDEEMSFRDRERRYEPRERVRIQTLERSIARQNAIQEAERRDRDEMSSRLAIWDDDESDESFYVDRVRWRQLRSRRLTAEENADRDSKVFEEREVENLKKESEIFLARQMEEMQSLVEEQRKAGLLLDDGAPVRLNVFLAPLAPKESKDPKAAVVFTQDEDEDGPKKRKTPLVKLDFSVAEGIDTEKTKERLEKIRLSVPKDKDSLFKSKVRWDGMSDLMVDRKFDPLAKREIIKYLGDLDDDLLMFVLEHLKDHKPPKQLVEGLEPVLEEDAVALAVSIWRQVIFESLAYEDGLHTDRMLVDPAE